MTDVTRPTPLAELTEALRTLRRRFWATHATGDQGLNDDYDAESHARSILALMPATAEAAALAALPDGYTFTAVKRHGVWTVMGKDSIGIDPSLLAAALAATDERA